MVCLIPGRYARPVRPGIRVFGPLIPGSSMPGMNSSCASDPAEITAARAAATAPGRRRPGGDRHRHQQFCPGRSGAGRRFPVASDPETTATARSPASWLIPAYGPGSHPYPCLAGDHGHDAGQFCAVFFGGDSHNDLARWRWSPTPSKNPNAPLKSTQLPRLAILNL